MTAWARPIVAATGVAELAVSAALLRPATRRPGALGAAGLIAAFLVAHVDAAIRTERDHPRWIERPVGVTVRLLTPDLRRAFAADSADEQESDEPPGGGAECQCACAARHSN
jgi:hypothetical protein